MAKGAGKPSSVERVIDHIVTGIRDGGYVPGQRLVIPDLAQKLGVSRGPVREAIYSLAGANVLEMIPNRGAVVRELSTEDILQMYQCLEILHRGVIGLAGERIGEGSNARRLKEAMMRIRESIDDGQALSLMRALAQYHFTLIDISGNAIIREMVARLHLEPYQRALASRVRIAHWNVFVSRFQKITNAILEGRSEEAQAVFSQHMDEVIHIIREGGEQFVF